MIIKKNEELNDQVFYLPKVKAVFLPTSGINLNPLPQFKTYPT